MLSDITPEWRNLMISQAEYIVKRRAEGDIRNVSEVDLYNDWLQWSGTPVTNTELVNWSLSYIRRLKLCSIFVLAEGVRIDKRINHLNKDGTISGPPYLWPGTSKDV